MSSDPSTTQIPSDPPPGAVTGRWHARIWVLAAPIILSNLSEPLLGLVDTAVMGHLPDPAYIGAVAIGGMIFSYLFWGFGFLRMGTTGLTAQAFGVGDHVEIRAALARPVLLGLAIGLAIIALQGPIGQLAFLLIPGSPEVEGLSRTYYEIRVWSAPASLVNYAIIGWLLGTQRATHMLLLQVVMNGLNVVLDLVFVIGLDMGVEGVAYASLIAVWLTAGLGLLLIARIQRGEPGALDWPRVLERRALLALFKVNFDIMIRTLCLIAAFSYLTAQGARMGDVVLAGNHVLMQFQLIMAHGLDGFAHAAEILAGSAYGARSRAAFRQAVRYSTLWAAITAAGIALVFLVAGELFIAVMTSIPEVRTTAALYLPWMVLGPLISVWGFQLDGIFIGATRTAEMRNAMLLSLAVLLIACWQLIPAYGNHGLWLAYSIFMVTRGLTLGFYYPALERSSESAR